MPGSLGRWEFCDGDWICGLGDDGKTYRQSILWYSRLRKATDEQRAKYEISTIGCINRT